VPSRRRCTRKLFEIDETRLGRFFVHSPVTIPENQRKSHQRRMMCCGRPLQRDTYTLQFFKKENNVTEKTVQWSCPTFLHLKWFFCGELENLGFAQSLGILRPSLPKS